MTGGDKSVTAIDALSQKSAWSAPVHGIPHGLAVAGGRLFVSTDRGSIYCFAGNAKSPAAVVSHAPRPAEISPAVSAAAAEILRRSHVQEGYCLDVDCGDGSLAIALAPAQETAQSTLAPTADEVEKVRRRVTALGLYGTRITVHQGDASSHRYGKYFADLPVPPFAGIRPAGHHRRTAARGAASWRRRCLQRQGRGDAALHARSLGQSGLLDAPIFRSGQHQLLHR